MNSPEQHAENLVVHYYKQYLERVEAGIKKMTGSLDISAKADRMKLKLLIEQTIQDSR